MILNKSNVVLIAGLGLMTAMSNQSQALSFSGVEHNINVGAGYVYQNNFDGEMSFSKSTISKEKAKGNKATNDVNSINLYVGYDAVFKFNSVLNPVVGVFVNGNIPLNKIWSSAKASQQTASVLDIDAKIGNRFMITKNLNTDIYGFVGAGIGYYNSSVKSTNESLTIMQKGMSAGAGIDVAYHNIVLGVYDKYTDMKGINQDWTDTLVKTHNVGVKIGYRFVI